MSSTNRGSSRENNDFYRTPAFCVERLLEEVELPKGLWLEPCAGDGAIIKACNSMYSQWRPPMKWRANEIDKKHESSLRKLMQHYHLRIGNFLTMSVLDMYPEDHQEYPDVIITNPPFALAMQIIQHSFIFRPRYIVMLLRLNFLASATRNSFFKKYMPDIYVIPDRPKFTEKGRDSIDYGWFVWGPACIENGCCEGKIKVLATTNVEDRK